MLHRTLRQSLGRPFLLCRPLVKNATRNLSLTKFSRRGCSSLVWSSSHIGHTYIHTGICVNNADYYESVKNLLDATLCCGEITERDIGKFIELQGTVVFISNRYLILKDKTGSIELSINPNRRDLKEWSGTLLLYSYLKLTGYVSALKKTEKDKKNVCVIINSILSVEPPQKERNVRMEEEPNYFQRDEKRKEREERRKLRQTSKSNHNRTSHKVSSLLEMHPEELAKCPTGTEIRYFFQRSHTCRMVTEKMCGSEVVLFGWVSALNEGKSFTLQDGYGSVLVVPSDETDESFRDNGKIVPDTLIQVEGVVTRRPPGEVNSDVSKSNVQIVAKSLKVVKDSPSDVSGSEVDTGVDRLRSDGYQNQPDKYQRKLRDRVEDADEMENAIRDYNRYTIRSHNCGELDEKLVGQRVKLMGWILFLRLNRFLVLKDRYGTVQLLIPDERTDLQNLLKDLTLESVISVEGIVNLRPKGQANEDLKSGKIEVSVANLKVLNKAEILPFYSKDSRPSKHTQLQYRYLDIRQNWTTKRNLTLRSETLHKMRRFLIERVGFTEVETPTLFRKSPGGAQEFIVPTRLKGEFYSLVQSPQQFKQLLMVGAIDRYFQIARCYRDETFRKDRQPEFTQLDIEMSFCDRDGVLALLEDLLAFVWPQNLSPVRTPFPRLTYEEVMDTYGSDKPDLRFGWEIKDLTNLFQEKIHGGKINLSDYMRLDNFAARAFVASKSSPVYSKIKDWVAQKSVEAQSRMFAFPVKDKENFEATMTKLFSASVSESIRKIVNYEPDDVVILGFGRKNDLLKALGELRVTVAHALHEKTRDVFDTVEPYNFLWVVDFPLFEESEGKIQSVHHPFTQPHPDDAHLMKTDPLKVRGLHYDLVLNGNEVGGGSIRIHDAALQREVIENILKLDAASFQHLLDALAYGAPMHGGFAMGIDRFIAVLCETPSISDVIAFPKTNTGRDPMSGAPCEISAEDKMLYHIH